MSDPSDTSTEASLNGISFSNARDAYNEARQRLASTERNDPCPCGSGVKYKKCHLHDDEAARPPQPPRKPADRRAIASVLHVAGLASMPPVRRKRG